MSVTETALTILGSVVGSSGLTAFAIAKLSQRKVDAEARRVDLDGDIAVGTSWREYALQMKKDMEGFREELNKTNVLVAELKGTLIEKDKHIASLTAILQNRNPDLMNVLIDIRTFMGKIHATTTNNTKELHAQTKMMNKRVTEVSDDFKELDFST